MTLDTVAQPSNLSSSERAPKKADKKKTLFMLLISWVFLLGAGIAIGIILDRSYKNVAGEIDSEDLTYDNTDIDTDLSSGVDEQGFGNVEDPIEDASDAEGFKSLDVNSPKLRDSIALSREEAEVIFSVTFIPSQPNPFDGPMLLCSDGTRRDLLVTGEDSDDTIEMSGYTLRLLGSECHDRLLSISVNIPTEDMVCSKDLIEENLEAVLSATNNSDLDANLFHYDTYRRCFTYIDQESDNEYVTYDVGCGGTGTDFLLSAEYTEY